MTKVKICGITNLEDALLSVRFGADALGFNFYEKSPRYITPEAARQIIDRLPTDFSKVGVFVNESVENIVKIADSANLDAIQLHGDEDYAFVTNLKRNTEKEIIKAVRVTPAFEWEAGLDFDAHAILLDGFSHEAYGGMGKRFDWEIAKQVRTMIRRLFLAGGISAENVQEAIREVRPYAVDVCSSIESSPGKKDKVKLQDLFAEARAND